MNASQQFKYAMLGIDTSKGSQTHIKSLAEECTSKLTQNPNLCPNETVASTAENHSLNSMQAMRLAEQCNQNLAKPVLQSKNKTAKYKVVDKKRVTSLMNATGSTVDGWSGPVKHPATAPKPGPVKSPDLDGNGDATKTASFRGDMSLREFATITSADSYSDYMDAPKATGSEYHPLFDMDEPEEERGMSRKEASRLASYREHALERAENELAGLKQQHSFLCEDFVKTAQQCVRKGGSFLEITQACLAVKPDKSTVGLLKYATQRLENALDITPEDAATWQGALDELYNNGGEARKFASGIGLPVADSLFSADGDGRTRIINGDSYVLKRLRTVEENEDLQFKSIGRVAKLKSWRGPRVNKVSVTNASGG